MYKTEFCPEMQELLDRIKPYVEQNPHFDIVQTKFGLVDIRRIDKEGYELECDIVFDYEDLLHLFFVEMSCDVRDDDGREHLSTELFKEEVVELRRRIMPYLEGLTNENSAKEALEEYLAEHS